MSKIDGWLARALLNIYNQKMVRMEKHFKSLFSFWTLADFPNVESIKRRGETCYTQQAYTVMIPLVHPQKGS